MTDAQKQNIERLVEALEATYYTESDTQWPSRSAYLRAWAERLNDRGVYAPVRLPPAEHGEVRKRIEAVVFAEGAQFRSAEILERTMERLEVLLRAVAEEARVRFPKRSKAQRPYLDLPADDRTIVSALDRLKERG